MVNNLREMKYIDIFGLKNVRQKPHPSLSRNTVWIICFGSLTFFMICVDQSVAGENKNTSSTNLLIKKAREPKQLINTVCLANLCLAKIIKINFWPQIVLNLHFIFAHIDINQSAKFIWLIFLNKFAKKSVIESLRCIKLDVIKHCAIYLLFLAH